MNTYMYIDIYMYMYTCIYVYTYTRLHTHIYVCVQACMLSMKQSYSPLLWVHELDAPAKRTRARTHARAHTHTHTQNVCIYTLLSTTHSPLE